jgi:demethylmenaquinone methyltransferase/2-methoxy-6-polyprenyl-1,4-benzoquinol methylase
LTGLIRLILYFLLGQRQSVLAAVSKEGEQGFVNRAFEWTHRHFPNLLDCRPIHVRQALEAQGFSVEQSRVESMWVPVEVVRARKPSR